MFHGPNAARTLIVMQITHTLGTGGVAHCTMWTWCQRAPEVKLAQFTRRTKLKLPWLVTRHAKPFPRLIGKVTLILPGLLETHMAQDAMSNETHSARRSDWKV